MSSNSYIQCIPNWGAVGLERWNLFAAFLHLAQAIALFVLAGLNPINLFVVNTVITGRPGANDTTFIHHELPVQPLFIGASFATMSALAHFIVYSNMDIILRIKRNPIRWLEYSVSASTVLIVICVFCGVVDVFAILNACGCTMAMIMFGDMSERYVLALKNSTKYKLDATETYRSFVYGTIIGIIPWAAIFASFFQSIAASPEQVPWFVYSIVFTLFFQFMGFGIVHLLQLMNWISFEQAEWTYVLLSLMSKSSLSWQSVFGLLL